MGYATCQYEGIFGGGFIGIWFLEVGDQNSVSLAMF